MQANYTALTFTLTDRTYNVCKETS